MASLLQALVLRCLLLRCSLFGALFPAFISLKNAHGTQHVIRCNKCLAEVMERYMSRAL